jgi:hypothetical protein
VEGTKNTRQVFIPECYFLPVTIQAPTCKEEEEEFEEAEQME